MKADIASILRCPARGCEAPGLRLEPTAVESIHYRTAAAEEVREGSLHCPKCGRTYPIEEYVPSFEQLFPPALADEADYWGRWYSFMWERGYKGFFDLREPVGWLITEGVEVPDPGTGGGTDLPGTHQVIADHPAFAGAKWLLDVGCGTGWSSLYFARRGHTVVAFDPSVTNMRLAKRYAIEQGEYVEYIGTGLGYLHFEPAVFDGVVALHSIHHVPDLRHEMGILRGWLRENGAIGIDEHVRNNDLLMAMMAGMHQWAQEEVYPKTRTLPSEVLAGIPTSEPSAMEGAGSEDVIGAFLDNFSVELFDARYITLDRFSFHYYLATGKDLDRYEAASDVVDHFYRFLKMARPEGAEYVTLIGRKLPDGAEPEDSDAAEAARRLAAGHPDDAVGLRQQIAELETLVAAKNNYIGEIEQWAHTMERELRRLQTQGPLPHLRAAAGITARRIIAARSGGRRGRGPRR